jgi:protein-tyrosine phosphatase
VLHWVTDDIAISGKPGARDWPRITRADISCVVDLQSEAARDLTKFGLRRYAFRIPDRGSPPLSELSEIVRAVRHELNRGNKILIHCDKGLGRSALVACAVLVDLGFPSTQAYEIVKRGQPSALLANGQVNTLDEYMAWKANNEAA